MSRRPKPETLEELLIRSKARLDNNRLELKCNSIWATKIGAILRLLQDCNYETICLQLYSHTRCEIKNESKVRKIRLYVCDCHQHYIRTYLKGMIK